MNIFNIIKNIFKIGKLLSVDDSGDFRFYTVKMLGKEQKILGFMPYGLFGTPPTSSMVNVWSQQGQESNGIGIADDPKNRIKKDTEEGEIGLGNYVTGDYIFFDENGNFIKLITANEVVTIGGDKGVIITGNETNTVGGTKTETVIGTKTITAPNIILNGNVVINGTLTSNSGGSAVAIISSSITHNGTEIGETHDHPAGTPPGDTGQVN